MLAGMGEQVDILRRVSGSDWRDDPIGGHDYEFHHSISDVLVELDEARQRTDRQGREDYEITGFLSMAVGEDIQAGDRLQLPASAGMFEGQLVAVEGKPFNWKLGSWQAGKRVRFKGVGSNGR